MSGIFISHSSQDDAAAGEVKAWLEEQGHGSVFLDFDPEVGIPAGRSWEQELYRQLRACRAVILVCSRHSMGSRWCFAEITHARSLGKPIFPLRVDDCEIDAVLTDRQIIDLTRNRREGFERLARGMALAGIDATNPFDWDGSRPPYPGLLCYQEKDAAIFFGRDREVGRGLDLLHQMRRYGGAGLLLVLGSSGSGKSSLVRAGVIPRLRRDLDNWLVIDAFRPGDDPWESLAESLAAAFERAGEPRSFEEIRDRLVAGAAAGEGAAEPLLELAGELRRAADRREATLLLVVDQFEELLAQGDDHPSAAFLARFAAALETPGAPLLAVATLRSDFLGAFQKNRWIGDMAFRDFLIGAMSVEELTEVIVRPAALAGLDMEPGLIQALLEDTQAEDALPLLAFTLRELYELATAESSSLGVSDYRERLGGLQGAVARAAEDVLASRPLREETEEELREAFLGMARMDDEGHFARDALTWNLLSERAQRWLERFVQARLLVARGDAGERTVEVAHEALFRAWDKLAGWLDENREAFVLRRELGQAAALWERGGRDPGDLWRGGRLQRALEVRDEVHAARPEPRAAAGPDDREPPARGPRLPMAEGELEFLAASEQAELDKERRRRRLRRGVVIVSLAIAVVMSVLALLASQARDRAREARYLAETRALATQARLHRQGRLDLSLLLSLEVAARGDLFESRRLLAGGLESAALPRLERLLHGHQDDVRAVAWSSDGRLVASGAGIEPALLLWDVGAERPAARPLAGAEAGVWDLDWSPDGRFLAAASADGAVLLWDLAGAPAEPMRLAQSEGGPRQVFAVRFGPRGEVLAAAGSDNAVRLWNVASGQPAGPVLSGATDQLTSLAWSPDGRVVAAGGMDRKVRLWRVETGEPLEPPLEGHVEGVTSLSWRGDGAFLISGGRDGWVVVWDRRPGEPRHRRMQPSVGDVSTLAFSPDAGRVVYGGTDGRLQHGVRDAAAGTVDVSLSLPADALRATLRALAWSPDSGRIASGHGRAVAIWTTEPGPRLGRVDGLGWSEVQRGVPSPDGAALAAIGRDPKTRRALAVWDLAAGVLAGEMKGDVDRRSRLAWSADGRSVVGVGADRAVRRWERSTGLILDEWAADGPTGGRVDMAAWSGGADRLALAAADGSIEIWDAGAGELVFSTPAPDKRVRTTSLAWSPDGGLVAAGTRDGRLRAWDAGYGVPLFDRPLAHGDQVLSLAWSPGGARLASGGRDGQARLWRAASGEPAGSALDHGSDVTLLAWSPDGETLASATRDRVVRLWDAGRGETVARAPERPDQEISALFFSPGGEALTAITVDGAVLRWGVAFDAWRDAACTLVNRNLTREEWSEYLPPGAPYRRTCDAAEPTPEGGPRP